MNVVLNASAVLAWLHDEPGADRVDGVLRGALMSTVNWAEVLQRADAREVPLDGLRADIEALGVELVPFDADMAESAGRFHATTRSVGLSLGDRACLSLAQTTSLPVYTADRIWGTLDLGLTVELIR